MLADHDEKKRAQIISSLYAPLPGEDIQPNDIQVGPWSDAEMAKSFRTTQATFAGRSGIK